MTEIPLKSSSIVLSEQDARALESSTKPDCIGLAVRVVVSMFGEVPAEPIEEWTATSNVFDNKGRALEFMAGSPHMALRGLRSLVAAVLQEREGAV